MNISISDVNDNAPEFDRSTDKTYVPENTLINGEIYFAHATDTDSRNNGLITYSLVENPGNMFNIDQVGIMN